MTLKGRRIRNCPFIILDLGNQDAIIGLKWMKRFNIRLDPTHNTFLWPSGYPPTPLLAREIKLPFFNQKIQRNVRHHQADANRRDRAFSSDIRRQSGKPLDEIPIYLITKILPEQPRIPSGRGPLSIQQERPFEVP